MGYWQNTTYVKHGDVQDVALAIDGVFAEEGMSRTDPPPRRTRLRVEPMQYDRALDNDLWGLAIFAGAPGWSIVKTAPLELLSERPAGHDRMRLAAVCARLRASAFQVNVYDGSSAVLVEVSAHGDVLMSGFNGQSPDPMHWNGIPVAEDRIEPTFELHPLQHLLAGTIAEDLAFAAARQIGGANAGYCDNLVCVDTLICHSPIAVADGTAVYYRWPGPSRQRHTPSDSYDAWRRGS